MSSTEPLTILELFLGPLALFTVIALSVITVNAVRAVLSDRVRNESSKKGRNS